MYQSTQIAVRKIFILTPYHTNTCAINHCIGDNSLIWNDTIDVLLTFILIKDTVILQVRLEFTVCVQNVKVSSM